MKKIMVIIAINIIRIIRTRITYTNTLLLKASIGVKVIFPCQYWKCQRFALCKLSLDYIFCWQWLIFVLQLLWYIMPFHVYMCIYMFIVPVIIVLKVIKNLFVMFWLFANRDQCNIRIHKNKQIVKQCHGLF